MWIHHSSHTRRMESAFGPGRRFGLPSSLPPFFFLSSPIHDCFHTPLPFPFPLSLIKSFALSVPPWLLPISFSTPSTFLPSFLPVISVFPSPNSTPSLSSPFVPKLPSAVLPLSSLALPPSLALSGCQIHFPLSTTLHAPPQKKKKKIL